MTNTQSWQGSDFGILLADAGRYWERQRIIYNAVLARRCDRLGDGHVAAFSTGIHVAYAAAVVGSRRDCEFVLLRGVPDRRSYAVLRAAGRLEKSTVDTVAARNDFRVRPDELLDCGRNLSLHRKVSGDSPKFNAGPCRRVQPRRDLWPAPKTVVGMVVDHAHGLHECVANRGANKAETALA